MDEKNKLMLLNEKDAHFLLEESYKVLGTNIEYIFKENHYKKLMITSSLENEERTEVALNLGIILSKYSNKVVVVECNFRNPKIEQYLNRKDSTNNLVTLLEGESKLEDCIYSVPDTNMFILSASLGDKNSFELLNSNNMQQVIKRLEEMFDYIIFDVPALATASDAIVFGKNVHASLIVVKHRSTTMKEVKHSMNLLKNAGIYVVGAVFSGVEDENVDFFPKINFVEKINNILRKSMFFRTRRKN